MQSGVRKDIHPFIAEEGVALGLLSGRSSGSLGHLGGSLVSWHLGWSADMDECLWRGEGGRLVGGTADGVRKAMAYGAW